jgi:hypothetical protein
MTSGVASRQWIRRLTVTIAGQALKLDDMEAQFQVRQTDTQNPHWAYVRILNLSNGTMDSVFQKNAQVKVEGGYKGRFGVIFDGNANQMRRGKLPNGVDKYLDVIATSGKQAYGFATVQESLDEGSTMRDVADKAIQSMQQHGVQPGSISERLAQKTHPRPVTLYGMSRDILRYVAEATNTAWHIHNNQLNIVDNDGYLPGGMIEANANTGMVGLPEQTLDGIVIKMLLNPDARPGQAIHVDASSIQQMFVQQGYAGTEEAILGPFETRIPLPFGQPGQGTLPKIAQDGIYKIVRVDHDGDMEGLEWYTTITALAPDDQSTASASKRNQFTARGIPEQDQQDGGSGGGR